MQTILINGRFLTQRMTGVQRYARETLAALDALLGDDAARPALAFTVLAPRGAPDPALTNIGFERIGPLQGHAWEQLTLARASRGRFLLSFGPTGPAFKRRQAVTIHDASVHVVPQAFSPAFRAWYKLLLPLLAQRSSLVMSVSEFARGEVVRYYGARADAVGVSGEGWQHVLRARADPRVLTAHSLQPNGYLLAVSSVAPHKNFEIIASALPLLRDCPLRVVVVGARNQRVFAAGSGSSRLEWLGYVDDGALRALYENAAAFLHPSRYEGFGIPPLEAMALGCPVIASNAAAIPEVCGPAALYFEPGDAAGLAAQIRRLLDTPGERERLRSLARAQLDSYSWEACARSFLGALRGLPDMPPARQRGGPLA